MSNTPTQPPSAVAEPAYVPVDENQGGAMPVERTWSEAPAICWTELYSSVTGAKVNMTVRAETPREALDQLFAAIEYGHTRYKLVSIRPTSLPQPADNPVNIHTEGSTAPGQPVKSGNIVIGTADPSWCPIHQLTMNKYEKDGRSWFSHKLPDNTWCRGKPSK